MVAASRRFRRADRVRTAREFRDASRGGRRSSGQAFVVLWCRESEGERPRLGLTVSRKVGNAVMRNRIKRRVREWFRSGGRAPLGAGRLIVIARPPARELDGAALGQELDRQLREVIR